MRRVSAKVDIEGENDRVCWGIVWLASMLPPLTGGVIEHTLGVATKALYTGNGALRGIRSIAAIQRRFEASDN